MIKEPKDTDNVVIDGSGSVFEDLNLPSGEEDMLKVAIARAINNVLSQNELTQQQAARITGLDQSKVSAILRGRLKGFSGRRLMKILILLGHDIDIHISKTSQNKPGRLKVHAASG